MQRCGTALLTPYRALGHVCSDISPVYIHHQSKPVEGFIRCAIENYILNYSIKPFRLKSVTNPLTDEINLVATSIKYIFAAIDNYVIILKSKNLQVFIRNFFDNFSFRHYTKL